MSEEKRKTSKKDDKNNMLAEYVTVTCALHQAHPNNKKLKQMCRQYQTMWAEARKVSDNRSDFGWRSSER